MQTFLSEDNYVDSAAVLDNVRLQKQYLEGYQILNAIFLTPGGGGSRVDGKVPFASNHPATNMWRGCEHGLFLYLECCRVELTRRGIKTDVLQEKILSITYAIKGQGNTDFSSSSYPAWWKDLDTQDKIIYTHRASLYKKDPVHYAPYADFALHLDLYRDQLVCCPGKHADYHYPTHTEKY